MNVIFLDRDGVINEDYGYVYNWKNFKLINGSLKALKLLTKHKFQIIIITNQSGIAKGFYTEIDFKILMKKFETFCSNNNIRILDVFYCPHYKEAIIEKYKKNCNCRKPMPGMFLRASNRYKINLNKSIMIGDKITDMIAAERAGIATKILLDPNSKLQVIENKINFKIRNSLLEACEEIIFNLKN